MEPLDDFFRDVLGWQPPWTLRELGQPLPTPEAVDLACVQVEAWCKAEDEASAQEQLRRMNEAERGESE